MPFLRETSDIRLGRLLGAISRENGCAKSLPKNKLSIIYLHSLSIILHKICSISKCISWIRGVDELGTTIFKSTHSFIAPPSRPLKPIILQPLLFAVSIALMIFCELPLVEIASKTSPFFAKAST